MAAYSPASVLTDNQAFPLRGTNSMKGLTTGVESLVFGSGFSEFLTSLALAMMQLTGAHQNDTLLQGWKVRASDVGLVFESPIEHGNMSVPFKIDGTQWKGIVAKFHRQYLQAIVQYILMSLISYMIDVTLRSELGDTRQSACLASVAVGLSGLTDPARVSVPAHRPQAKPLTADMDSYYIQVAALLTSMVPGRVYLKYNIASQNLLFSISAPEEKTRQNVTRNAVKTTQVETWEESVSVSTTRIRALDQDVFIINANIAAAIMAFSKDGKNATMINQLPALVEVYAAARNLKAVQPVVQQQTRAQTPTHRGDE